MKLKFSLHIKTLLQKRSRDRKPLYIIFTVLLIVRIIGRPDDGKYVLTYDTTRMNCLNRLS
jgi:hypothetical protein